ncbi:MAG: Na+/H+ antiporter NhaA [Thermoleophilia bacterium]|nr:Na+/H+ antiporter NhaA [Thermoleophilia bacterium]
MSTEQQPDLKRPWGRSARPVPRRIVRPVQQFLHAEAASGIILLFATVVALAWANLDPSGYYDFWHAKISLTIGGWTETSTLAHAVNDGLMAIFFFVIGLEVKRELTVGELADRRAALLPLAAAVGGMLVPAALFLLVTAGSPADVRDGWGIPMATDIAFALGVLALLGSRVPAALKVLVLGIAVIDDIGAIIVIAIFYSSGVAWLWLLAAGGSLVALWVLQRLNVRSLLPYVAIGTFTWYATYSSGIHATIAGVALGLLTPSRAFQRGDEVSDAARRIAAETRDDPANPDKDSQPWQLLAWLSRESVSPLTRVENAIHPWSAGVVLPIFALANVGVVIDPEIVDRALHSMLALGIAAGLVIGKPLGILLGSWLAVRLGAAALPTGVRWSHVVGAGALAGIGFTMSLFVTTLAYHDAAHIKVATMAVLGASVVAGVLGAAILLRAGTQDASSVESAGPGETRGA